MSRLDAWFARAARGLARRTSRRSFLARLGALVAGATALPLLPVARAGAARAPAPGEPDPATPVGDPEDCAYWRYCAIDGFLASCCGGTQRSCPPGTSRKRASDPRRSGTAPGEPEPSARWQP